MKAKMRSILSPYPVDPPGDCMSDVSLFLSGRTDHPSKQSISMEWNFTPQKGDADSNQISHKENPITDLPSRGNSPPISLRLVGQFFRTFWTHFPPLSLSEVGDRSIDRSGGACQIDSHRPFRGETEIFSRDKKKLGPQFFPSPCPTDFRFHFSPSVDTHSLPTRWWWWW